MKNHPLYYAIIAIGTLTIISMLSIAYEAHQMRQQGTPYYYIDVASVEMLPHPDHDEDIEMSVCRYTDRQGDTINLHFLTGEVIPPEVTRVSE